MIKSSHIIVTETILMGTLLTPLGTHMLTQSVPLIAGTYVGSYLPDVDHAKTKINHQLGFIGKLFAHLGHRGITHSLIAVIIIGLPLIPLWLLISPWYRLLFFLWLGLFYGYLAHLVEDNFSIQGILWCYPFTHYQVSHHGGYYKKRHYSKLRYRVNSHSETMIRHLAFILLLIFSVIYVFQILKIM